jgi:CubicO group peptidase (beta-lactamase class C family)
MTKPITSLAVMVLYEEGHFLLDDPISKYLPEFRNPKVLVKPASGEPYSIPATREITIRDLPRYASRLTYQWNDTSVPYIRPRRLRQEYCLNDGTIACSVKRLAALPLLFNPGDRWGCSPRSGCPRTLGGSRLRQDTG